MPSRPPGTPDVDLTLDDTYGIINYALFSTGQNQPAGTGVFNSFVQIQHNGSEQGYNTDASAQYDEKSSHNHNHSILLADVPIVIGDGTGGTTEGVTYREFLLDLNEPNGNTKPYLSLDALQIWQEESGSLTNFTPGSGFAGAHTNYLAYNLDAGGNHWIGLNDGLSHGSGQSDIRVLIPDSFFINDAAHRYVTLYSQFGLQSGWEADGGFEEWGVHGASGGARSALNIQKSASVPGGTADTPGEDITYSITLSNTGNQSLTGITVTDPSVSDLTRGLDQVGNNDNILNAGEVWTYSAHHVVTQADIDGAATGGDGFINNMVSAGSDQTGHLPEQLDTASTSVPIDARPVLALDKSVSSITSTDLAPGTTVVDAAGDVINYIVSVSWGPNANTTLTGVGVTDPTTVDNPVVDGSAPIPNTNAQIFVPVLDGDTNLGDNNNNGIADLTDGNGQRDSGETFQYVYIGDTNQNGFHDPGEIWEAYNLSDTDQSGTRNGIEAQFVGDTNNNGVENAGEKWQFQNVWDGNNNGLQDNDEIWHYQNVGDQDQSGGQDPGETFQYYNAGDTNQNGGEDPGETFQYYNVGDTNHNGVEDTESGETFQFDNNLPALDANFDGFNDGDVNMDGAINAGETWYYVASYTVTQADIDNGGVYVTDPDNPLTHDNTATVTTNQQAVAPVLAPVLIGGFNAGDTNQNGIRDPGETFQFTAYNVGDSNQNGVEDSGETFQFTNQASAQVVVDQNPAYSILKEVTDVDGGGSDGHVDAAYDVISYTITVENTGNMTLTGVSVDDALLTGPNGTLSAVTESGIVNGALDVGETWTYTGTYTAQQADINNNGGGDGDIDNTATVHSAQLADQSRSTETTIDRNPAYSIVKSVTDVDGGGVNGHVDEAGDVISYQIVVSNDGNVDLTGTSITDALLTDVNGTLSAASGDTGNDGTLGVGEVWTYTGSYTAQQSDIDNAGPGGHIDNTATVQSDELADQPSSTATPVDYNPAFTLSMVALGYHDTNGSLAAHADAGDTIDFELVETNTGNATLHNILVGGLDGVVTFAGSVASLGVGATDSTSITGTRVISAGDVGVGYVEDEAVGQADEPALSPFSGTVHVVLADLMLLPA